jgi:hypothetical protein
MGREASAIFSEDTVIALFALDIGMQAGSCKDISWQSLQSNTIRPAWLAGRHRSAPPKVTPLLRRKGFDGS